MSEGHAETSPETHGAAAMLALILGIISLPMTILAGLGIIPGVISIILGARSRRDQGARGVALIGMGLGFLGTAASALMMLSFFTLIIMPRLDDGITRQSIGKKVSLELTTLTGASFDSTDLAGERVLIDVWATWCGPCVATIPALDRLAMEADVVVIGITFEDPEHVRAWMTRRNALGEGPHYPIVAAGRADVPATIANVRMLPTMFLLDGAGVIREARVGAHGFDELQAMIDSVPRELPATSSQSEE